MSSRGSVSSLIQRLRDGDSEAATKLWRIYEDEIQALARRRLRTTRTEVEDHEDVVIAAFDACFRALERGKYPSVVHRTEFKKLLFHIAGNKVKDIQRRTAADRRNPGPGKATTPFFGDESHFGASNQITSQELSPEVAVAFADELRHLINLLDEQLQRVAKFRLEGYTQAEIADELGVSIPTIERRCRLIRKTWKEIYRDEDDPDG